MITRRQHDVIGGHIELTVDLVGGGCELNGGAILQSHLLRRDAGHRAAVTTVRHKGRRIQNERCSINLRPIIEIDVLDARQQQLIRTKLIKAFRINRKSRRVGRRIA